MNTQLQNELSFIVYCGISERLDSAITNRDTSNINLLNQLVTYYCDTYGISGSFLTEKLNTLKNLK